MVDNNTVVDLSLQALWRAKKYFRRVSDLFSVVLHAVGYGADQCVVGNLNADHVDRVDWLLIASYSSCDQSVLPSRTVKHEP